MPTHTFHVAGLRCGSCRLVIEDLLTDTEHIIDARVDLKNELLEVNTGNGLTKDACAKYLNDILRPKGYLVHSEKTVLSRVGADVLWKAVPIGLGFLMLFFLLQKSGLLTISIGGQVTPLTGFVIGLIASVSSCLAVVGGLVLSLSAKISQDDVSDTQSFMLFHVGRLVSFAVLGGVLGLLGRAIGIHTVFTALLGLFASAVMILVGLNLVGVLKKNRVTLPPTLFNFFRKIEHKSETPLILGVATFFLPCGFTQSMQISALSSASFVSGLTLMLSFALGTAPMLIALSFGSASLAHGKHAETFYASAGIIVIGLGLFSLFSGLVALGIINPIFII